MTYGRQRQSSGVIARVFLKEGRERSVARRHPWIFSGAVARVDGEPQAGDVVEIANGVGHVLARAAYSPASQIRARIWTFDPAQEIDDDFLRARLARAVDLRRRLGLMEPGGACRLVFAESDGMPGFIADRYGDFVVCQFLAAGVDRRRETIAALLRELCGAAGVYERSEAAARRKEGLPSRRGVLCGDEPPALIETHEHGVVRLVDVAGGQKTGAYLDQRDNRARVRRHARDGDILDAFSYTGGFALACLAAGARHATLVDSSAEALAGAARDADRNGVSERCDFTARDVFEELRALVGAGRQFDLVVLDPPKFVHSAEQVRAGARGYKDINVLAMRLVRPGGILATFSCSGHVDAALFQKIVAGAAVDAGRDGQILERLGHPPDHPVALEFPEGEYLKGLILRVH
jgi:23S rRNA (cytosine1962-C5)-methyltransferase